MTRTPRAAGLASILAWARSHPLPTALAAVLAAVLAGAGMSLAIGAIRSAGVGGAPDATPTPLAAASSDASPTESPTASPAPSPSAPPATLSPGISGPPVPSGTPEPSREPVNGRIAWDAPGQPGGGTRDIVSANPDGSDLQFHTASGAEERNAVWSPDGRSIAYISDASGGSVEVIGPEGPPSVVHAGSFPHGTYYSDGVAWAPDSTRLALALVPGGVEIVDLNGIVTASMSAGAPRHVAWSPSGDLVAFVDGVALMVGDAHTSETHVVTSMATSVRFPMWTPDEQTLLFHGYTETGNTDLFAVDLDGTNLRNVTASAALFEDVPSLSPGGVHVAVVVVSGPTQRIEVMELDGGERRTLLTMSGFGSAAWSPDGTALAVGHGDTITILPIDGSPAVDIGTGSAPSWGRAP